jgi:hypothetical protein
VPLAVLMLILIGTAFSFVAWQPPTFQTAQFGTPNSLNDVMAITSDTTGVYAAGFVGGARTVGYGNVTPRYLFVNRYDLSARLLWTQQFGDPHTSTISDVGVGSDGVYAAGSLTTSSFVRKYDLNGNPLWTIQPGTSTAESTSISIGRGVYAAGNNGTSYLLRDYDFNGSLIWTRPLGNSVGSISVHADAGGVYVIDARTLPTFLKIGTSLVQKYYPNGTLAWTDTCSCDHAAIAGDSSGIYVTGTVQTPGGASNGFLGKYDFNGNQLWTTSFSPHGYIDVQGVKASADSSGVYITGGTAGGGLVIKYDSNGNEVWSVQPSWWPDTITVEDEGIYLGGYGTSDLALIALMSKSSSLVFFGVNPPLSFGVLGLLVAVAVASILWFRRRWKKRFRPPSSSVDYRSQKIPVDLS